MADLRGRGTTRQITFDTLRLAAGTYAAGGITAITYVVGARVLHPMDLGIAASAVGVATFAFTAADFGLNSWTVRALAARPGDFNPFTDNLSVKACLAALIALVGGAVTYVLFSGVAIAALLLSLMLMEFTLMVPFRAERRMGTVAVIAVLDRVATIIATTAFAATGTLTVATFLACLSFGPAFGCVVAWAMLRPGYRRLAVPSPAQTLSLLKSSVGFGATGIFAQLQRLDVPIVGLVIGAHGAGIYAAPARVINLLNVMPTALSSTILPTIAAAGDDRRTTVSAVVRAAAFIVAVSTCVLLVGYLLSPWIVAVVLGPQYSESVPVLRVFLVGTLAASINQPVAAYLQARGHDRLVAWAVGPASAFGLLTVAAGAAVMGPTGGALGFVALQTMILTGLLFALATKGQPKPPRSDVDTLETL